MDYFYDKRKEKLGAFLEILEKSGLGPDQVSYMGDDLPDIEVLQRVGWAATVPGAVSEVKEVCHFVTRNEGGMGAVREVCDLIRKSR